MIFNSRGRQVNWNELYPMLGVYGAKLPSEGFTRAIRVGSRVVEFRCDPALAPAGRRAGKPQRVKFLCDCGRWIPFGRANQHLRRCEPYQIRETEMAAAQWARGAGA